MIMIDDNDDNDNVDYKMEVDNFNSIVIFHSESYFSRC